VALARVAIEQLQLDELRIIPTGDAWHKSRDLTAAHHRLKMAELAFGDLPRAVMDDREIKRVGPSYTIETLEELQAEQPDSELFLVIGGDQEAVFRRWHRWQDILQKATVCVADRPLQNPSFARAPAANQSAVLVSGSSPATNLPQRVILHLPLMPVSATAIRQQLAFQTAPEGAFSGELDGSVPDAVASYISLHGLYQARPSPNSSSTE
jgi:nicotinate-nucleotide adenylyltransferase